jgi:hypothetical protein
MINPLEDKEGQIETRGRGLGRIAGDNVPGLRPMPGDYPVGERPLPGDYRMAGSKIRGLAQYDPMIFRKLFA